MQPALRGRALPMTLLLLPSLGLAWGFLLLSLSTLFSIICASEVRCLPLLLRKCEKVAHHL